MSDIKQLALPFIAMVGVIVAANYFVLFPFQPFGFTALAKWATWGTLIYPITFLVNDLTNRLYGTEQTTKLILASFVIGLSLAALVSTPRIAIASGLAFLIAQQLDNKTFHHFRNLAWWRAPLISSTIATFVDTWIFYIAAFWGATENADYFGFSLPLWVGWSSGDLIFKLALVLLLLLPYRVFSTLILSRQNVSAP
jgi:uncharacterized PurR-regulated membrane protein YhhQ (DUF165 family)